jgi:hypothetical protein
VDHHRADGRLVVSPAVRRVSRSSHASPTTFGMAEQPGTTVTFRIEQDKVLGITLKRERQHDRIQPDRGK